MEKPLEKYVNRRGFLRQSAALPAATAAGLGFWSDRTLNAAVQNTSRAAERLLRSHAGMEQRALRRQPLYLVG